jgi:hypothetical protein
MTGETIYMKWGRPLEASPGTLADSQRADYRLRLSVPQHRDIPADQHDQYVTTNVLVKKNLG